MKCWDCGKEGATQTYEHTIITPVSEMDEGRRLGAKVKEREILSEFGDYPHSRHFCQKCFEKRNEELRNTREQYARLKKRLMFERAIKVLEKQAVDIYEYKDIIDQMSEYVEENPEKFDSAHEIIAAIILVDNAVKVKMQYKVGKYCVDFYIPEYKIILEIDGDFHKNSLFRDNQRDIKLRELLGNDWETVRISTAYIEQNARALVDAMLAIKAEKQNIRKQHNGFLPEWYSVRDKAKRKRGINTGDDHLFDI